MMKFSLLAFGLCACLSSACASTAESEADWTAYYGATFYLGGPSGEAGSDTASALLLKNGRVFLAGHEARLRSAAPEGRTRWINLGGGVAVPALWDGHGHVENLGLALEGVDLRGASLDELVARARAQAQRQATGTWIEGRAWDQNLWPGGEYPGLDLLSEALPEHPVLFRRVDGHAALCNRLALERAGLWRAHAAEPQVQGGRVLLDERGYPSGVLIDAGITLVANSIASASIEDRKRRILRAQEQLLSQGLIAVCDMGNSPESLQAFQELDRAGELELFVFAYLWANEGLDPDWLAAIERKGRRLFVVGAKLMIDGALGSRGAALFEDYSDAPGERGHLLIKPDDYALRLREVVAAGLQPATHAIGDRANRIVLDAYEAELEQWALDLAPRLEHAQVLTADDLLRLAQLGVIPSVQPTHATSDMPWARDRLGDERLTGAYAWRALAPDSSALVFGSDFPVEDANPLLGLYAARTTSELDGTPLDGYFPTQRMGGREALAGFSANVAHAVGLGGERGKLLRGYFADFVVLDVDPVEGRPEALLDAEVLHTIIEGRSVFAKP